MGCCCYTRAQTLKVTSGVNSYFIKTYYERNKKTLWQACRFVVGGTIIITVGLVFTVLGYFDKQFSTTTAFNGTFGANTEVVDHVVRVQFKSMQYLGPVMMGFGTFMLILACVLTLESRDRHAQTIHEESSELRKSKREASAKAAVIHNNDELHRRIRDPEMDAYERVPGRA
ncbi:Protein R05D7.3 c [Aphelenchoides avenae]|nr:Protein R05D7.3 c [Aphelenchus avenae]